MMKKQVGATLSEAAGLVDELWKTREKRYRAQKVVEAIQKEETEIRDRLVQAMSAAKTSEVSGRHGHGKLVAKVKVKILDWDQLYAFVAKHKAFEFLQKRVNEGAVKERWEARKTVPGVEPETFTDLSLGAAGK